MTMENMSGILITEKLQFQPFSKLAFFSLSVQSYYKEVADLEDSMPALKLDLKKVMCPGLLIIIADQFMLWIVAFSDQDQILLIQVLIHLMCFICKLLCSICFYIVQLHHLNNGCSLQVLSQIHCIKDSNVQVQPRKEKKNLTHVLKRKNPGDMVVEWLQLHPQSQGRQFDSHVGPILSPCWAGLILSLCCFLEQETVLHTWTHSTHVYIHFTTGVTL